MDVLKLFLTNDFYSSTLNLATPLIFAAVGGVLSERSGVLNMALEGQILMGSFFAFWGSCLFQSVYGGLLFAILSSMVVASLHAFMSIKVKVNQMVSAIGINMLCLGITSTLYRFIFGKTFQGITCLGFTKIYIPGLSDIPFLGSVLLRQNPLTYVAILSVMLVSYFLYHTSYGLHLRAAGENPKALDVAGVDVLRIRWCAVLATGFFCGLAGASLTIAGVNAFYDNISSGRGFIAYAAIVFGRWTPVGAMLASLLFGAGDALQLRMQALSYNIPYYFYAMLPYLITFLSLILFMGSSKGPLANAIPFEKDKDRQRAIRNKMGGKI